MRDTVGKKGMLLPLKKQKKDSDEDRVKYKKTPDKVGGKPDMNMNSNELEQAQQELVEMLLSRSTTWDSVLKKSAEVDAKIVEEMRKTALNTKPT